MDRLPISICMIAGAEAGRIGRALESVVGWAGEIVVLINEDVNDGTDKIAKQFGAAVFREPWKGYVAQKNSAAAKAAQPWILGLDADEAVSAALADEIKQLFSQPDRLEQYAAFSFPRCAWFCGRWIRHGDWYPDRKTRLWRRGQASWGGVDLHEKLEVNGQVGKLRNDLLHFTAIDLNHHVLKSVQYADIFARRHLQGNKFKTATDLALRPLWRFVRSYIFRLGFLDGWQGLAVARLVAFHTFIKYARILEQQQKNDTTIKYMARPYGS